MDIINKISEELDSKVRILRYIAPTVASIGVIIILRKTYAFSMFKNVHEIPIELISHNKRITGYVEGIIDGKLLAIQHTPIFFRNLEKRKQFFGEDASPFHVSITGIEPRDGCLEHLQKEVILQKVRIIPLGISSNEALEAVLYLDKGLMSRSVCLNESLVLKGLAVVHAEKDIHRSKAYVNLSQRLLKAEVYAERKGYGVWKKPSVLERFKTWISSVRDKLPFIKKS